MTDYPWNLHGSCGTYKGRGRSDGETQISPEFNLKPGIVIAEITHDGQGDFKLEFVPADGIGRGKAAAASLGGSLAAGAATGAAVGSVVPVAGTLLGGLAGGIAGWLAGGVIDDAIGPNIWTSVDGKGPYDLMDAFRIREEDDEALKPGRYRLEVQASGPWTCRFIQPSLGQSAGSLVDEEEEVGEGLISGGVYVLGPYESGTRPVLAEVRHAGGGDFVFIAYALDGTHQYAFAEEGQFYQESIQTEIRPGKEYMLLIASDGDWGLIFTEGY